MQLYRSCLLPPRGEYQCSHQNLQAKGHKYLMTTPIILNAVIVCCMCATVNKAQVVQVAVKCWFKVEPKGTLLVFGQTQSAQCPLEKA